MNDSLKYNRFTSATKTTAMTGGNTAALNAKNEHTIDCDADEDNVNNLGANTGEYDDEMDEDHGNVAALIDKNDHAIDCDADEDKVNNLSANTGEDGDEMDEDHGNTASLIDKNDHTIDDEADEDYAKFLSTYTGEEVEEPDEDYGNTDALIDKNNQTIDDDADEDYMIFLSGYTGEDDDETDEDYRSFLATYDPDILTDCSSNHSGGSNGNSSGSDETDADYAVFLPTYNPDDSGTDCASNHSGGSNIDVNFDNNTGSEDIGEGCSYFPNQSVSDHISDGVAVDEDDRLLGKRSSVGRHSLVSDQEFHTPEVQLDVDEDYEQFLNSVTIVDDDKEYFRDKNTRNTSNVENGSNSSDSDLIILDSYPICENTPFVSSKTYDTSVNVFNFIVCLYINHILQPVHKHARCSVFLKKHIQTINFYFLP